MKRLWKVIPPCMSDVLGFEAVLNETKGFGVIDDPSRYKSVNSGRGGGRGSGGYRGFGAGSGDRMTGRSGAPRERRGGHGGGRGWGRGSDLRVADSEIRDTDIITGTQAKVLSAAGSAVERLQPEFLLLCHAPSSSMIGSDLESCAREAEQQYGIPTAFVDIDGSRDYLYGVGAALEAMGRLLLTGQTTIPGTVNLLGCNTIDWTAEELSDVETWLTDNGWRVLSRWGMKDDTSNLRNAAAAEKNLVVSEAGLPLARYMERQFGIPYAAGAPFGAENCAALLSALEGKNTETETIPEAETSILVIGEQFTANAIRRALAGRGMHRVQVLSFFDMDKSCMLPGDAKLTGEDDLAVRLKEESLGLVFCDPNCKPLAEKPLRWVDMPNPGLFSLVDVVPARNIAGEKLDQWLEEVLE